jgi:hypothetical protein
MGMRAVSLITSGRDGFTQVPGAAAKKSKLCRAALQVRAKLESPESLVSILDALTTALPNGQFCEPSIAETGAEDESLAFCSH